MLVLADCISLPVVYLSNTLETVVKSTKKFNNLKLGVEITFIMLSKALLIPGLECIANNASTPQVNLVNQLITVYAGDSIILS